MSLLTDLQGMYDPGSKTLRLDTGKLGALGASLLKSTGSSKINFAGVPSLPVETAASISFQGSSLQLSGDFPRLSFPPDKVCQVSCSIYQADTNPVLVISITLVTAWQFPDSLPWLTDTFWADLALKTDGSSTPGTLLISTGQIHEPAVDKDLAEGIYFYSTLDEAKGLLGQVSWMLGSMPRAFGPLVLYDDAPPAITLELEIRNEQDGLAGLFKDLQVPLEAHLVTQSDSVIAADGLHLIAALNWAGKPAKLESFLSGAHTGIIELYLDGPLPLPSPEDVARYLGDTSVTQYLPAEFSRALNSIHVGNATLGIGLGSKKLEYTSVTLTTLEDSELTIVPQWVMISDISFSVTIFFGMSGPHSYYRLSGRFDIGGVDLLVSGNLVPTRSNPSLTIIVQLEQGDVIDLTMIATKFGLPPGAPKILVDEFCMSASTAGTFFIRTSLSEHPVGPEQSGFIMSALIFELDYDGTKPTLNLQGIMEIAGVDAALSLSNEAGWVIQGEAGEDQPIKIGTLIADLGDKFGVQVPASIESLDISKLKFKYHTGTGQFFFTCEGDFIVSSTPVAVTVTIDITPKQDSEDASTPAQYDSKFGGEIRIGPLVFDLVFDISDKTSRTFIATYSHTEGDASSVNLQDLIKAISTELASNFPGDLKIDLKDVKFIFTEDSATQGNEEEKRAPAKFLFGLDLGAEMRLSHLPLVGNDLASIGIEDLQLLIASQPFEASHVEALNRLLPKGVTQLPMKTKPTEPEKPKLEDSASAAEKLSPSTEDKKKEGKTPPVLAKGINLSALLKLGKDESGKDISTPLILSPSGSEEPTTEKSIVPASQSPDDSGKLAATTPSVTWIKIQKSFGPVRFERIGFQFQSERQAIWFLLDASLAAAGLTLSLDGLGLGSSITEFGLEVSLHGLGIYFKRDQLEIGGAFLRRSQDEYGGTAIFKTDTLSLSAIGLYKAGDQPSMFIYAFLDYPLGGPPVFYVTGLAAGFGYNRALVMPPIDQVKQYPLVAAVRREKPADGKPVNLNAELQNLCEVVPVQRGQYLLAAGVKFTSFKMIDSFALLAVSFGEHLEIDILGFSTIKVPFSEDEQANCLAKIEIAFKASFIPADGFLGVMAQLTSSSYILSKDCHLTGGMAFYSWFSGDHAGDFVLTVGGYHSDFKVPAHYPQVPRLAINWQVSSALSIKGDAYFALTPSALMAGGHLEATWQSGPIKAWFTAGADFLIAWQPFHYDARVYVDMGVRYTFWFFGTRHITVELGADLHIWGPEFSGVAHIHLWCVSFSVSFGAGASEAPKEIEWSKFQESFLPEEILSLSVKNGLVSASSPSEEKIINLGVINPKDFSLVVDSVIPVKTVNDRVPTDPKDGKKYGTSFGIAPMNITDLRTSNLRIMLNGTISNEFTFTPITKNVPTGLWGTEFQPDLNSEQLVENVICGFEITPAEEPKAGGTAAIDPLKLQDQLPTLRELHVDWEKELLFSTDKSKADQVHDHARRQVIQESLTKPNTTRQKVLADLGLGNEKITIDPKMADIFMVAPQIEAASM